MKRKRILMVTFTGLSDQNFGSALQAKSLYDVLSQFCDVDLYPTQSSFIMADFTDGWKKIICFPLRPQLTIANTMQFFLAATRYSIQNVLIVSKMRVFCIKT